MNYFRTSVFFTRPNQTMFERTKDAYIDSVINTLISNGNIGIVKRFNVIYSSLENPGDLMIKTAPADEDFILPSESNLLKRVAQSFEGYFVVTPTDIDVMSKNNQVPIFAQRTKLIYPTYEVLLELEVRPEAPAESMNSGLFQTNIDIHLIYYIEETGQMIVMSQTAPFHSEINYSPMMTPGYLEQ